MFDAIREIVRYKSLYLLEKTEGHPTRTVRLSAPRAFWFNIKLSQLFGLTLNHSGAKGLILNGFWFNVKLSWGNGLVIKP